MAKKGNHVYMPIGSEKFEKKVTIRSYTTIFLHIVIVISHTRQAKGLEPSNHFLWPTALCSNEKTDRVRMERHRDAEIPI